MDHEACPTCGTLRTDAHRHELRACETCQRPNPVGFRYCGFCAAPMEARHTGVPAEVKSDVAPPPLWNGGSADDLSPRARDRTDVYPTPSVDASPRPLPSVDPTPRPTGSPAAGALRTSELGAVVVAGEIVRPLADAPRHRVPLRGGTVAVRELQAPAPWREPDAPEAPLPAADTKRQTARIRPKGIDESIERARKGSRPSQQRSGTGPHRKNARAFGANVLSRYGR